MKSLFLLSAGIGIMAFGVWLGVFVMFIPGITGIISQCQAETFAALVLATAIAKVVFAWPAMVFCIGFASGLWRESSK